jgi:uncharacterized protein YidB (DUF937 family)
MGILDQILSGGAAPGSAAGARNRGVNSKLAAGVLVALAIKAMRDRQRTAGGSVAEGGHASAGETGGLGGILGGLGGLLGGGGTAGAGGGLGSILGGLGGAGALGGLIGALQQKGLGQQANSWVGAGDNHPVAPHQLAEALGEDTIEELQSQTGLPREQLLTDLAKELPDAVNDATPDGRLPDDDEVQRIASA